MALAQRSAVLVWSGTTPLGQKPRPGSSPPQLVGQPEGSNREDHDLSLMVAVQVELEAKDYPMEARLRWPSSGSGTAVGSRP